MKIIGPQNYRIAQFRSIHGDHAVVRSLDALYRGNERSFVHSIAYDVLNNPLRLRVFAGKDVVGRYEEKEGRNLDQLKELDFVVIGDDKRLGLYVGKLLQHQLIPSYPADKFGVGGRLIEVHNGHLPGSAMIKSDKGDLCARMYFAIPEDLRQLGVVFN